MDFKFMPYRDVCDVLVPQSARDLSTILDGIIAGEQNTKTTFANAEDHVIWKEGDRYNTPVSVTIDLLKFLFDEELLKMNDNPEKNHIRNKLTSRYGFNCAEYLNSDAPEPEIGNRVYR